MTRTLLMQTFKIYVAGCPVTEKTEHETGRELLRRLYTAVVGEEMPVIEVAEGGKPFFLSGNWHFSITHTHRHCFCALAPAPVGLDAEEADRPIRIGLAEKILSPRERDQFEAAADKRQALLKFWVLKEAQVKFTGRGLEGYPRGTDFSLEEESLFCRDGCVAAVICGERNKEIIHVI